MTFKPEQAQAFFSALTGEANPVMTWQTFCDYEKIKDDPRATWWNGYLDPARLADHQAQGCGVFATINGGGRYASDINKFRAVFMDSDGIPLPAQWVVIPHIIVMRDPTHYHAYWLLDGDCSPAEFSIAQKQIALHYGSDGSIFNPDRVMRVPGYLHQKDLNNKQLYELTYLNTELPRYKLRDILPYFPLAPEKGAELAKWINQRNGQYLNEAEDYDDCEANQLKYIEYLTQRAEHGVDGEGRNHIRFKTAAAGRDYGLSPETTVELMLEHWDHGNTPPCGPELIETSVHNAYRYNQNKLGSRSLSIFLQSEVQSLVGMSDTPTQSIRYVPEPPPAPSPQQVAVERIAQLTSGVAPGEIETPDGDGWFGKNHMQNALAFLSMKSPNGEVLESEGEVYVYNGKIFERKPDKYLQGVLSHMMAHVGPSDADLNGAANVIKHRLRTGAPQRWPQWREDRDRNTDGLVVFDNGILDIHTNEWFDHTPLLRARNCLPFAYDHTATCPNWEKFLDDVWGNGPYEELIVSLQKWFGYLLTNDQSQQKMAFFIGKPRAGKGTMMRVIENMLGKHNCASPSLSQLSKDSILHFMSDKMAAIFNDAGDGGNKAEVVANIKRIVGQDSLQFDRKYLSAASAQFRCRLMLTCNAMPDLAESSTAMVDRGIFFYLDRSHSGIEDFGLGERLEREMPGILNWAIRGLQMLRADGRLTNPDCVRNRIAVFRSTSNPLESFVREHLVMRSDAYVSVGEVYRRYRGWAIDNDGGGIRRQNLFARQMDAMPGMIVDKDSDGDDVIRGAYLKPLDVEAPE
nr:MAG: RepB DNA-primase from phage plasmid [Bacteriophage sp.]